MAPNERTVEAVKQIEEMILRVLRYFRWNRKSDLKRRRRDGESDKAFPLTPPSPSGRGRTCERFVNDRGILASIPRIEARPQGGSTNTRTIDRPDALIPSRRAEWSSLSLRERAGVRGKALVCRLQLSFQPLAPISIPSRIARKHFAASNPPGVTGFSID
jgi:hypothetical protein